MKQNKIFLDSLYESLEKATTVTLRGQQIKSAALAGDRSFNNFNKLLFESISDVSVDNGLNAWANETIEQASDIDKVLVKFNSVMESLSNAGEGFHSELHNNAFDNLEYLTDLDSADLSKAISDGVLNDYGWIPEFKDLNDELTAETANLRESIKNYTGSAYSPFSMLSEQNGNVTMRLKGKNWSLGRDGRLYEAEGGNGFGLDVADGVNDAIETIPYNDKDDMWELDSPVGMITISPYEKCIRLNGDATSCEELKEALTECVKDPEMELSENDVHELDHVLRIAENLDDIALLDSVKIFENEVTHENMVVVYPDADGGTEISVIQDGKVEYATNIENILGYVSDAFKIELAPLRESFSKQIKTQKLYEAAKAEDERLDLELVECLEKQLKEVDDELAMVDIDSEAAVALSESRTIILNEMEKVKKK